MIAPYVVRARAGAPVAMPIAWEELANDMRNDHFNLRSAPGYLAARTQDRWAKFVDVEQSITLRMRKQFQ